MKCTKNACGVLYSKNSQLKFILLFSFMLFLFSCGEDGKQGDVYIRITNGSGVCPISSYTDNNPGIPNTFYLNAYYKCNPGTYSYTYIACQEYWRGSYVITAENGEDGGFLSDGDNGKTRRYTLQCWGYSEPDFTYTLGKTTDGWKMYPDIVTTYADGTTIRMTRECRPILNANEQVENNKLSNK